MNIPQPSDTIVHSPDECAGICVYSDDESKHAWRVLTVQYGRLRAVSRAPRSETVSALRWRKLHDGWRPAGRAYDWKLAKNDALREADERS